MAGVLGDYTGSYPYDATTNETIIFSAAPDAKFDVVFEATNTSAYWGLFLALAGESGSFTRPRAVYPVSDQLVSTCVSLNTGFLLYHWRQGTISQLQRWPLFALTFSYGGAAARAAS
jgi:hypothetical protein